MKQNCLTHNEYKSLREIGGADMTIDEMMKAKKISRILVDNLPKSKLDEVKKAINEGCPEKTEEQYLTLMKSTLSEMENTKRSFYELDKEKMMKNGTKMTLVGLIIASLGGAITELFTNFDLPVMYQEAQGIAKLNYAEGNIIKALFKLVELVGRAVGTAGLTIILGALTLIFIGVVKELIEKNFVLYK